MRAGRQARTVRGKATTLFPIAIRARDAGFEWLELRFAHRYPAQSFFPVHANQRTGQYGGDAQGRGRFIIETPVRETAIRSNKASLPRPSIRKKAGVIVAALQHPFFTQRPSCEHRSPSWPV
jgi:hypothetical protein